MAIYDFSEFQAEKKGSSDNRVRLDEEQVNSASSRFFSSLAARLFFFALLLGDLVWLCYTCARIALLLPLSIVTAFKIPLFNALISVVYLALKRGLISFISLFVSLFSPALGIMFACTYFLMYDRAGVKEIVPSSLQAHFHEFMQGNQ